jgi:hypothetical protein
MIGGGIKTKTTTEHTERQSTQREREASIKIEMKERENRGDRRGRRECCGSEILCGLCVLRGESRF